MQFLRVAGYDASATQALEKQMDPVHWLVPGYLQGNATPDMSPLKNKKEKSNNTTTSKTYHEDEDRLWLIKALSGLSFAASSVAVPPVGVFFPVEKITATELSESVLEAAHAAEDPDPVKPVAVLQTRRSGRSVAKLVAL